MKDFTVSYAAAVDQSNITLQFNRILRCSSTAYYADVRVFQKQIRPALHNVSCKEWKNMIDILSFLEWH